MVVVDIYWVVRVLGNCRAGDGESAGRQIGATDPFISACFEIRTDILILRY
jgi:hypothetical protein